MPMITLPKNTGPVSVAQAEKLLDDAFAASSVVVVVRGAKTGADKCDECTAGHLGYQVVFVPDDTVLRPDRRNNYFPDTGSGNPRFVVAVVRSSDETVIAQLDEVNVQIEAQIEEAYSAGEE